MWHKALQAIGALALLQTSVKIPEPRGYINDFANVISSTDSAHIQAIVDDVRAKSGGDIVVVTLPDLGTAAPSDVALQIGRTWKVGKLGKPGDPTRNTGVIILLQPKETASSGRGQCYIGVGYGSEGFITDATSGQLCRDATDDFRARQYGAGLAQITLQVAQRFADEYHFTLDTTLVATTQTYAPVSRGDGQLPLAKIIFIVIIIIFFDHQPELARIARRVRRLHPDIPAVRRWWTGMGRRWLQRRRLWRWRRWRRVWWLRRRWRVRWRRWRLQLVR